MKRKLSIKFIAFSLILCITLSSVLSSYTDAYTVNADDGVDFVNDFILLVCSVAGMLALPEVQVPIAIAGISSSVKLGFDVNELVRKNDNGTATISADTIAEISRIALKIEGDEGFNDDDILTKSTRTIYFYAYGNEDDVTSKVDFYCKGSGKTSFGKSVRVCAYDSGSAS